MKLERSSNKKGKREMQSAPQGWNRSGDITEYKGDIDIDDRLNFFPDEHNRLFFNKTRSSDWFRSVQISCFFTVYLKMFIDGIRLTVPYMKFHAFDPLHLKLC